MFFWKCWRDTRLIFLVLLVLMIVKTLSLFSVLNTPLRYFILDGSIENLPPENGWVLVLYAARGFGSLSIWIITGMAMGSISVGVDIGKGSGDFMLTRPRSRKYFVWTGWSVGMAEILILWCVTMLVGVTSLYYQGFAVWRHMPASLPLASPVVLDIPLVLASPLITATVIYGLTYFLSVLTRSAWCAVILSFALICVYAIVNDIWPAAHLPGLIVDPYWTTGPQGFHEWPLAVKLHLTGAAICLLAFPAAAQLVLDRSDI